VAIGGTWELYDQEMFQAVPSLAEPRERGLRPAGVLSAAQIRFTLPSVRLGLQSTIRSGTLQGIDEGHVQALYQRFAPEGQLPPEGLEHRDPDFPAFRATLRALAALSSLDGADLSRGPGSLEQLPACDFLFLDNLYFVLHDLPVGPRAIVTCERCAARFVPVL
jgi:hypothetical protein